MLNSAIIVLVFLVACSKNSHTEEHVSSIEDTVKAAVDMESESATEEKTSEQETPSKVDKRYMVGDTIQFMNGLEAYIADVGVFDEALLGNGVYVYVDLELKNNGNEAVDFSDSYVEFYGDNYKINGDISPSRASDRLGSVSINVGRQARGRCYILCDEYNNYSVIEAQINDAIIVMKDDTLYTNPNNEDLPIEDSKSIYGIYSYDNGMTAVLSGAVGPYSDSDEDYIMLEALSYGNRYIAQFNGVLTQIDENTYRAEDGYGNVIKIVFDGSGMQVDVESASLEEIYELNGYYIKTGVVYRS